MTRSRWLPHPPLTLLLAVIWILLVNAPALGNLLLGLLLGWLIPLSCRRFLIHVPRVKQPLRLCRYSLMVLWDILIANFQVARLVIGPKASLRPAFVEIPMDLEDDFLLTVLACIISLTPGTVSSGLSEDHKVLLVHGLDVDDIDALIAEIKQRYEVPLLEMFECSPT